ncbi:uncharacterized protein LOC131231742 [Magnolia sinica]|uniref:uncharacterized protein LOC131231742 n=1 Tax=Magnolia sinica TaxID=86752 RepID=UPI00265936C9|nr:uncharacterized protein LOC131231742 [Magnolia sinica]
MVNLATYLLEGEAENWWQGLQRSVPPTYAWTWAGFKTKFLEKYFPRSCRNEKIAQFLKLEQGNLTVAQYEARFDELSRYVSKALEDAEYKLQKFKEGLRQGIQSRLCAWDFEDFAELVDKAMRVEKDFERTLRTRSSAREAPVRPRQAPPAPSASERRARVIPAGAPPMPTIRGCEYCHKIGHSARSCFKKMRDEGIAPPASHPHPGSVATKAALRPQMQRMGPPVHQRAPARVFTVATADTEEDLHQTIHGTAHIHGTPVFLLFDSGATLSFMDSTIANRLGLNITRIHAPLVVASPMGKFLETDKICKDCPLTLAYHEVAVDLILMPMKQFDIILGMNWLSRAQAVMDCRNKTVTITVPGQASFIVKGKSKHGTLERLQALEESESVESAVSQIPVVREFPKVFQEIPGLPPRRVVDFFIDLKPGTAPISLPPF